MYLNQLIVQNFRSLEDIEIGFKTGLNVLVGKNNAGKSNVIEALNILLGEKWPTYLEFHHKDFFREDSDSEYSQKFLIAVRLTGNSYNRDLIIDENIKCCRRTIQDFPRWDRFEEIEDLCNGRGDWPSGEELAGLIDKASSIWFFLLVPRDERKKERVFGALLIEKLTGDKVRLNLLQRYPQEFREALLTTARIPAFRDPMRELRVNNYSWYGRLIRSLYESKSSNQNLLIEDAQTQLSEAYGDIFKDASKDLCNSISDAIFHHNISFEAAPFTLDESHKNITIFVDDGINAPFFEKGSGIQSALIISLFGYYCEKFHSGGSLLLAEEPELYLHPHARRAVEGQLLKFASSGTELKSTQVVMATHATEFIRNVDVGALVLVTKGQGATNTSVRQVEERLLGEGELKRWRQIVGSQNAEMFFGDHAILVEGGEEFILPMIADLTYATHRWLDIRNISVTRVGGKMQFANYSKILASYKISHTILTDLDFLRRGAGNFRDKLNLSNQKKLDELMRFFASDLGTPVKTKHVKAIAKEGSLDWIQFYNTFDEFISELSDEIDLDEVRLEKVKLHWEWVKERIKRNSIREALSKNSEMDSIAEQVIEAFKDVGIFVLKNGELEDYYTEAVSSLLPGDKSKDRLAAAVAESLSLCDTINDACFWIHIDEFQELLSIVGDEIASQKLA